ncbi:MAG: tRNA (guanosine(37)-N1)-methyltransferase TrmD [Bacilli bacterium]|jgi:tRNA (guanine37-N1)-methyltransferase|nr:tRNA (guanosine(37)-N1)-methyltransferase TrmD [Bacilli bacterium]MDD3422300.1 tRNA (guanosine(37)-N1)-methyltransferase TrmD [Bacilli bacterium]MDD4065737.1 tRNA (guanosine(37)-N1)-methyltransferase TrmD [Bacilli bacterium]
MKIDILTLFPEMFTGFLDTSIIKRAVFKKAVEIATHDIRSFTLDKNGRVDDCSVGGGAGLIMKCQPVLDCLASIKTSDTFVVLTSPRGVKFNQALAHELASKKHLVIICGHYEGVDQRISKQVDLEVSIGDYILTGGELPAMVISDAIIRLEDGAISEESIIEESFENGLLEYPQYALPREYNGEIIPDILFSGNHTAIAKWRLKESLRLTKAKRPDLLVNRKFTKTEQKLLNELEEGNENPKWLQDAVKKAKKFMK